MGSMTRVLVKAALLTGAAIAAVGIETSANAGRGQRSAVHSCVVIRSPDAAVWRSDAESCRQRLSPASTFKIPHALVGLETGALTMAARERWDGTPHSSQPKWNMDHTVLTAMRPSVLWFFQRLAPRIGAERMRGWLEHLGYGNADTSGDVTLYWINGRLRVSADEQLTFLTKFFAGTLPFAASAQREIRDALRQKPATVENARGVHPIAGDWSSASLHAKTGATTTADNRTVSWLVGALTSAGREHVFASVVWNDGEAVDSLEATRRAVRTFIDRGLVPAGQAMRDER
jgi:beta-lactamase class D